jgi:hypothetical protein
MVPAATVEPSLSVSVLAGHPARQLGLEVGAVSASVGSDVLDPHAMRGAAVNLA